MTILVSEEGGKCYLAVKLFYLFNCVYTLTTISHKEKVKALKFNYLHLELLLLQFVKDVYSHPLKNLLLAMML